MRLSSALLLCTFPLLLTGCNLQPTDSTNPTPGLAIHGTLHGGQSPISNSRLYLMAASTAGYGLPSTSLLTLGNGSDAIGTYVLTDTNGSFNITPDYTCTPNTQVYLLALGGNPGLAAGTNNTAIAEMAVLGNCPVSRTLALVDPVVSINEVSTVAAVYSLAGFMTGPTAVSNSGTPLANVGLANAFATFSNLVAINSGMAYATTPNGNGTVPQATINTLANIVSACVNSTGAVTPPVTGPPAVGASPCYTLFTNALSTAGAQPTDTVTALLNIAKSPAGTPATTSGTVTTPGSNTNLFALSSATPAFQPTLTTQPNDFTLMLNFTGGGVGNPIGDNGGHDIAVDASGNIWSANDGANALAAFTPLGVPLSPAGGFTGNGLSYPVNLAIDTTGNIFLVNQKGSSVSAFTSAGAVRTGSPYPVTSLPDDIAIDASGDIWTSTSLSPTVVLNKLSNSGAVAGGPYPAYQIGSLAIAAGPTGTVWASGIAYATGSGGILTMQALDAGFTQLGTPIPGSPFYNQAFGASTAYQGYGNAVGANGSVWTLTGGFTLIQQDSAGNTLSISPFPIHSFVNSSLAIDGAGSVWINDTQHGTLSHFSNGAFVSGSDGYSPDPDLGSQAPAIDGSGNVWYATVQSTGNKPANSIRELVGAATPVVTPIAAGVANNTLGTRP